MAAPIKRALDQVDDATSKKPRLEDEDVKLTSFLDWCQDGNLQLSEKVCVTREGSCAQYGMLAVEDIAEGEVIFTIPRTMLLTPEASAIADILDKESASLKSKSGWVPLLLSLLYEYSSKESQWRAYLDLVPDFDELDLPMFWPKEALEDELAATGVKDAVLRDEKNIEEEFNNIALPFMKNYPLHFAPETHDLLFYKKMVAFVMAYSFTEPPKEDEEKESDKDDEDADDSIVEKKTSPMMVPMADILNHVSQNNANLDFGETELKMVAIKEIKKGEEVYNTYGQLSNMNLLHMYGFTEEYPNNIYDVVEITHSAIEKCLRAVATGHEKEAELFERKWQHLLKVGAIDPEGGVCVISAEGILTEPEMQTTLKVLTMDEGTFKEYHENEEAWDEEDEESLLYADFHKLPIEWKEQLDLIAKDWLSNYPNSLAIEESQLESEDWLKLSSRQQKCVQLRYGQMQLLHTLCEHCHGH